MRKDSKGSKDLTEIFSVGSNDSDPSIGEIRKKIKNKNILFILSNKNCLLIYLIMDKK